VGKETQSISDFQSGDAFLHKSEINSDVQTIRSSAQPVDDRLRAIRIPPAIKLTVPVRRKIGFGD
jgi:hypothetical protein